MPVCITTIPQDMVSVLQRLRALSPQWHLNGIERAFPRELTMPRDRPAIVGDARDGWRCTWLLMRFSLVACANYHIRASWWTS